MMARVIPTVGSIIVVVSDTVRRDSYDGQG